MRNPKETQTVLDELLADEDARRVAGWGSSELFQPFA
jgi:hypothetical protein